MSRKSRSRKSRAGKSEWNTFRSKHKNKGYTIKQLSRMYSKKKRSRKSQKPSKIISKPPKSVLRRMNTPKISSLSLPSKFTKRSKGPSLLSTPSSRKRIRASRGDLILAVDKNRCIDFNNKNEEVAQIVTKGPGKGTVFTHAFIGNIPSGEDNRYKQVGTLKNDNLKTHTKVIRVKDL